MRFNGEIFKRTVVLFDIVSLNMKVAYEYGRGLWSDVIPGLDSDYNLWEDRIIGSNSEFVSCSDRSEHELSSLVMVAQFRFIDLERYGK
ncbi:hypothetical protein Tco_1088849 [Tanacetum coccineum]